jgi:hypothetical protein
MSGLRDTASTTGAATPLATGITGTSYTDATVSPGTTYTHTVAAYDAAGKQSGQSDPAPASRPVGQSATDDVAVASVQFQPTNLTTSTTTSLGAPVTSSPYQTTWNTSGVSNGQHALSDVATDEAGNTATSIAVDVTAANTGPSAPTVNPATPATGAGSWARWPRSRSATPCPPTSWASRASGCRGGPRA